jgi:glycosyltransferase involved in cell wall biosynthesis
MATALRATVVADVPSPHQNVFFDAVARLGEVDLEVLFCRRVMPGRAWSGEGPRVARHRFLRKASIRGVPTNPTLVPELLAAPERLPLLIGYYLPAMLSAGLALGALGRPWIFWTDTLPAPAPAFPHQASKEPLYRRAARSWFLSRSTLVLTTGEAGRKALLQHGVARERTQVLPFVVDHGWIQGAVDPLSRDEVRAALGIAPGVRALLFVGQMIRRKGIDVLLDALLLLQKMPGPRPLLLAVGDGAELPDFRAQATLLGLDETVRFIPGMDNAALPRFWAAADAFVLPSRFDAWPVVVVEALVAGLPVIGTDLCGSVRDLVTPAAGFVARAGDVLSLAEALRAAMGADLLAMRPAARAAAAALDPARVARDFTRVIEAAHGRHAP